MNDRLTLELLRNGPTPRLNNAPQHRKGGLVEPHFLDDYESSVWLQHDAEAARQEAGAAWDPYV